MTSRDCLLSVDASSYHGCCRSFLFGKKNHTNVVQTAVSEISEIRQFNKPDFGHPRRGKNNFLFQLISAPLFWDRPKYNKQCATTTQYNAQYYNVSCCRLQVISVFLPLFVCVGHNPTIGSTIIPILTLIWEFTVFEDLTAFAYLVNLATLFTVHVTWCSFILMC